MRNPSSTDEGRVPGQLLSNCPCRSCAGYRPLARLTLRASQEVHRKRFHVRSSLVTSRSGASLNLSLELLEDVVELLALGLQVALVVAIRLHLERDTLADLYPEAL